MVVKEGVKPSRNAYQASMLSLHHMTMGAWPYNQAGGSFDKYAANPNMVGIERIELSTHTSYLVYSQATTISLNAQVVR